MKPADDAVLLDTSHLDADQALAKALEIIAKIMDDAGSA
jgi:cytidylate kinase